MSYNVVCLFVVDSCSGPHILIFFFFLMIRRPPRSTLDRSSAASDVYKRQPLGFYVMQEFLKRGMILKSTIVKNFEETTAKRNQKELWRCLLYTSPSPRDRTRSRMPSSA